MIRCSDKAYAMCPDRNLCGQSEDAAFADGSDCAKFNREVEDKPMTNAGRIRSISDEELADALQKFCIGMVDCSDCPLYAFGCPMSSTFNDWLEWLHKPAGIA